LNCSLYSSCFEIPEADNNVKRLFEGEAYRQYRLRYMRWLLMRNMSYLIPHVTLPSILNTAKARRRRIRIFLKNLCATLSPLR
ncbi:MAG: hypothetical protein LBJ00_18435, partial [Planctomycetaceae bacterium]|nr:hypothetical protein [Planctomycetaceae bacterium]